MTSMTFGGTVVAAVVSFFLAIMRVNDILKYFRNNSHFTKPKERAIKLNVLLNEERTFYTTMVFHVPFHERSNVPIIYHFTNVRKMNEAFDILLQKEKNVLNCFAALVFFRLVNIKILICQVMDLPF